MQHARLAYVLAAALLITLIGSTVAAGAPAQVVTATSDVGQVTVAVTVRPTLACTFTDDGVIVRSNVGWVVSAPTASGEEAVFTGGPTAGEYVVLPQAAGPVEVRAQ